MLYDLWLNFIDSLSIIHRTGMAFLTSLFLVLLFGNRFIYLIKKSNRFFQPIRTDGPESHMKKKGTPTLGGVLIILSFMLATLLWIKDFNNIVKVVLFTSGGFALIGLVDDLAKLFFKNSKGISGKLRLVLGILISFWAMTVLIKEYPPNIAYEIYFPYIKSFYIYAGVYIFAFGAFVIVGTSNSVNLTDGLDGLASMVVITILVAFLMLLFLLLFSDTYSNFSYSSIFYYNKVTELLVIIGALIGAILGFLWFNASPAKIFMGDMGALGIGAAIGTIAVALKQEFFLALAGIILIIETFSVIIQVYYYKITKKRIFLMAPIHHHYEKKGYNENKIVKRIWLLTVISSVVALMLLAKN